MEIALFVLIVASALFTIDWMPLDWKLPAVLRLGLVVVCISAISFIAVSAFLSLQQAQMRGREVVNLLEAAQR